MAVSSGKNKYQTTDEDDDLGLTPNYLVEGEDELPLAAKSIWHRKVFWLLLVFSLAVIFLISWYLKVQVINQPLAFDLPDYLQEQLAGSGQNQAATIEELRNKDTDEDGLNDYQEIYQFYTSIFLADTDSDGFSDAEETKSGNDPLCPTGEKCNLLRLITPNSKVSEVVQEVNLDPDLTLQQATLLEFRKFLVDNGLPQSEVDDLTDEELLLIITAWEEGNEIDEEPNFAELTPGQVRAWLLAQPEADIQQINNLTDEQLLEIRDRLISQ